ncbi:MAG: hypothetical protein D3922_12655, partial [Candidatus Electrothrix sp. AR1]|nr:hypothetical protein [Candidatus Electrothrix sp. AR1]
MAIPLRSNETTQGRRMAGARALWRANGMTEEQIGKPIIAVVNSFTQMVPGHVHLHEIGQQVKQQIQAQGCFAAEFNTIAIVWNHRWEHDKDPETFFLTLFELALEYPFHVIVLG